MLYSCSCVSAVAVATFKLNSALYSTALRPTPSIHRFLKNQILLYQTLKIMVLQLSVGLSVCFGPDPHQLHFEVESGVRRDHSTSSAGAIAELRRNNEFSLPAHLHIGQETLVPSCEGSVKHIVINGNLVAILMGKIYLK